MADEFDAIPSPLDDAAKAKSVAGASPRDEFDAIPSPLDDARAVPATAAASDSMAGSRFHTPLYLGQEVAKGAIELAALPRTIGDFINSVTGWHWTPTANAILPSASGVEKFAGDIGLNTLRPQDAIEQYGGAAARGVGATIPTLPLGGEGALAQLVAGAASGVGAELGRFLSPDSWWGPVLGGVAAGLTGGKAVSLLAGAADGRAAAAELARQNAKLAVLQTAQAEAKTEKNALAIPHLNEQAAGTAALRQAQDDQQAAVRGAIAASQGLKDQVTSAAKDQISQSKATLASDLEGITSRQSAAAEAATSAAMATKEEAGKSLADLAAKRTAETDPDKIGQVIQAAGHNFLTSTLPKYEDTVHSTVNGAMNGVETPIDSLLDRVASIAGKGGEMASAISRLSPNIGAALKSSLAKFLPPEEGEAPVGLPKALPEAEAASPPVPTWQDVKQFRSALGEAKANPMVLRDFGEQNLDSLYQATTEDLRRAADAHGVGQAFDIANSTSQRLRQFAEGPIAQLVAGAKPSANDVAPGKLVNSLLSDAKQTGQTLAALRAEPSTAPAVDELAGHVIRQTTDDPKVWNSLAPGAKVALVPDPAERTAIEQAIATRTADLPKFNAAPFEAERQAAQAAHEARVAQAQDTIASAAKAHAQSVQAARDSAAKALRTVQRANADAAMARRQVLAQHDVHLNALSAKIDEAKAAIAQIRAGDREHDQTSILHGIEALASATIFEPLAEHATNLLGLVDPTGTGGLAFANKMIAAGLPMAYHGAKNLLGHPQQAAGRIARGAAIGAVTQPNAISTPQ